MCGRARSRGTPGCNAVHLPLPISRRPETADLVLALQRRAGNQAVARAFANAAPAVSSGAGFLEALAGAIAGAGAAERKRSGRTAPYRALQRAVWTRDEFVALKVEKTTIGTLAVNDPDLRGIADHLARYHTPPPTASPLTELQAVSTLCKHWLAANPKGWVSALPKPAWGAKPSQLQGAVVDKVRPLIEQLHESVQQPLVDLAAGHLGGVGNVWGQRVEKQGHTQTPSQAKRMGKARYGDTQVQKHWEGWKIHVSVPDTVAGDVVADLVPRLERAGVWFKSRRRIDEYRAVKDESAGKFLVIYPRSVAHLEEILGWLEGRLAALVGAKAAPGVAGDVQLDGGGYVWARYGVFLDTGGDVVLGTGEYEEGQHAVWDPVGGGWVKDARTQPVPAAWEAQLRAEIAQIRAHRRALEDLEQEAAQARGRPRAHTG